jgi:uncharacterized protein YdhG (YjbR/CyaY superfamily)
MKNASIKKADDYIRRCSQEVQGALKKMRAAIREAAPGAEERMDYFEMPGYSYDGEYDYSGMFAWFSYKKPLLRVHIRPEAIKRYEKDLAKYKTSRGIVSFPSDKEVPAGLIKKLVKASVKAMKDKAR